MVFRWRLSDIKCSQSSRTLLRILADFCRVVVEMILILLSIYTSSNLSFSILRTVPRTPTRIRITVTFMFHSFYSSQAKSWYCLVFLLLFSFYVMLVQQNQLNDKFFCFVNFSPNWVIRLYLKAPEIFMFPISENRFWFVHIPFIGVLKLTFLAQFSMDLFPFLVMPSLVFFI